MKTFFQCLESSGFYLNMFQPPPADENAAEADGDAGEDEEDKIR